VLYSTIQYSMILAKMKPAHADVVRHWLRFSQSHRGALLKGTFTPHHPENGYTWIEGEDEREKVVTTYSNANFLPVESGKKTVYVVNACLEQGVVIDSSAEATARLFDVFGVPIGTVKVAKGLSRLPVPACGYAEIRAVVENTLTKKEKER